MTNIDGARATELKTSEIFRIVKLILLLTSGETNTLLSPTKKKKGFRTMAVKYKLYQDVREQSEQYGLWYGRAAYQKDDVTTTNDLAEDIESETTLTKVDVKACIEAFIRHINRGLRAGNKVKLDGLGTFKCGLRTSPAKSAKEFTAAANVKGIRVIFQPAVTVDAATHKRSYDILDGVKVREMADYHVDKTEPEPEP